MRRGKSLGVSASAGDRPPRKPISPSFQLIGDRRSPRRDHTITFHAEDVGVRFARESWRILSPKSAALDPVVLAEECKHLRLMWGRWWWPVLWGVPMIIPFWSASRPKSRSRGASACRGIVSAQTQRTCHQPQSRGSGLRRMGQRRKDGGQIEGSETSHGLESGAISWRQTERRNPGRHGLGSHLASMSQIDGLGLATLRLVSRMLG
jgi:hypothetical protein